MAEEEPESQDIESEVKVLEELADGSAKRHSLDPVVSDFSSGGSPEEIYAALSKWHAQGLLESTVPNPDVAEDGVQYRWQLNFAGKQYLALRGHEDKTPEETKAEQLEAEQEKPAAEQEQEQQST